MKSSKFLLLSFLFLFTSPFLISAYSQELAPNFLFLFGQIYVDSETTITHTLTAQGTYWELDEENEEFPISTDSDLEEAYATITGSTTSEPTYSDPGAWKGFYFPWLPNPYQYTDDIAYGIYKVSNSYNTDYFYIDIRDCKYSGPTSFVSGKYLPDFFIRFNDATDIFKWKRSVSWTTISKGEVLTAWDMCNNGTPPTTSYFEDFWENCLVVVNNGNGNPKLIWGLNPDFENIIGYKIYRAVHWVPNPDPIVYSLIATVADDETFEYTDTQLKLTGNGDYVWYYVKAYNNQGESPRSNVVTTRAGFYKKSNSEKFNSTSYGLNQNFPNPFNPSTTISYSIENDGLVTLKVYDILGNEVATLVSEKKSAGYYSVEFNASDLTSGIYFYTLTSGNFTYARKMILLR